MKIARVAISPKLLLTALHLPEDTTVVGADVNQGTVRLVVVHDGLKDQPEGALGEAAPRFIRDADGTTRFMGWGQ